MNDREEALNELGLHGDASWEQVERTYRDLVGLWRPEKWEHDARRRQEAQQTLKAIDLAYARLQALMAPTKGVKQQPGTASAQSAPSPMTDEESTFDVTIRYHEPVFEAQINRKDSSPYEINFTVNAKDDKTAKAKAIALFRYDEENSDVSWNRKISEVSTFRKK